MMKKKVPKKRRQECRCSERFNAPPRKHFYLKMKSNLAYKKEKKTIWIETKGQMQLKTKTVVLRAFEHEECTRQEHQTRHTGGMTIEFDDKLHTTTTQPSFISEKVISSVELFCGVLVDLLQMLSSFKCNRMPRSVSHCCRTTRPARSAGHVSWRTSRPSASNASSRSPSPSSSWL